MTKKFEVGDKVRLTKRQAYTQTFEVGHVATVVDAGGEDASYVSVRYDGDVVRWRCVHVNDVELVVEDKRKFSIGDKVRVVNDKVYGRFHAHVGKTGEIKTIEPSVFGLRHIVHFDANNRLGYEADEIELIATPAAPSPKFNVGDRVKRTANGRVGTVEEIIIGRGDVNCLVHFDGSKTSCRFPESQLTLYSPRTWSKPDTTTSLGIDVIDPLVDEMTTALRAHGGDCETRRFGDVMVVVENGQAKIYRLEATSNVE